MQFKFTIEKLLQKQVKNIKSMQFKFTIEMLLEIKKKIKER